MKDYFVAIMNKLHKFKTKGSKQELPETEIVKIITISYTKTTYTDQPRILIQTPSKPHR